MSKKHNNLVKIVLEFCAGLMWPPEQDWPDSGQMWDGAAGEELRYLQLLAEKYSKIRT